ncbi:peptidoglycan DD-metalloendopeptidase family protein [Aquipuribacter nitratireducens]|uniref:Peptidoglycan DD-metalloendopeptidase family protein n=1 Tax=Aquipuribacter nitratireducens TaxID=650104 RepID=A0ABW0GS00_9MICO
MPRSLVGALGVVLLAAVAVVPQQLPAAAGPVVHPDREEVEQRQDEVERGLAVSEGELAHVNGQLVAASERLAGLQAQVPAARQAVATAEAEAAAARQRDAELAQELVLAEAAVEAAGLELGARTAEADRTQQVVGGVAREVYQGATFNPLQILVEAGSAKDYADMVTFAQVARRSQEQALSQLRTQQVEIRNAEARLEAERVRVEDLKAQAAQQVVVTAAAEEQAREAQAALERLVAEEDAAVRAYEQAKAAEEAEIAELEAENQQLEVQLAAIAEAERKAEEERQRRLEEERRRAAEEAERRRQEELRRQREEAARDNRPPPADPGPAPAPAPDPGPQADGYLSAPVSGARISSNFGYRIHPILGYRKLHTGRDYAAACGTPVRAAASGRVVSAGWGGGYGNLVVISHGRVDGTSLATAYAHLSRIARSGGSVSRGEVIGYIGTTGSSTGCHLHFETREAGVAVDPRNWL